MALAHCILGEFLGVGCHCFPPPLDVPTFSARCLHVQWRERPLAAEGGTLRGREMFRQISSRIRLPRHGTDGFTSPPREGVLRNFFALKIRQLRPGVNPRIWVPKASTLPLDHRSRSLAGLFYFVQTEHPFCQYRCNLLHKCYREETHKHDQRQGFRNICKSIPHSKVSD